MNELPEIMLVAGAPLAMGGLEKHLLSLAGGLQEYFNFSLVGDPHDPFRSEWERVGLGVHPFHPKDKLDLAAVGELRRLVLRRQPDVIHIHDSRAGLLARMAKIGVGVPTAYSLHYPAYQYVDLSGTGRWFNAQVERVLNWLVTDAVIFPYRNTYHHALRRRIVPRGKAHLIPSGIDIGPFVRAAKAIGDPEKTCSSNAPEVCRLVVVSRLAAEKNIGLALQTTAELVRQDYPVALMIAGDGPLRKELEEETVNLGISDAVQFLGFRSDIPQVIAQADICLLTSRFEAGPYVIMEAMAAGRPCVATPVGDVPWLLFDGAGVVVDDPTPEKFSAAVAELIEDKGRRRAIGRSAKQKAEEEFSIEHMLSGYEHLYRQLIRGER
jgi:glycosyltransferase involved in cell wall biosynthesis